MSAPSTPFQIFESRENSTPIQALNPEHDRTPLKDAEQHQPSRAKDERQKTPNTPLERKRHRKSKFDSKKAAASAAPAMKQENLEIEMGDDSTSGLADDESDLKENRAYTGLSNKCRDIVMKLKAKMTDVEDSGVVKQEEVDIDMGDNATIEVPEDKSEILRSRGRKRRDRHRAKRLELATGMSSEMVKQGETHTDSGNIDPSQRAQDAPHQPQPQKVLSKGQKLRARQALAKQNSEEQKAKDAIYHRLAQKISADDTLLDLVKNSSTKEGRAEFLDAVAAIEPAAAKEFNLLSELHRFGKRYAMEPLLAALQHRHSVKSLRESMIARENAELYAHWEETLSPEEVAKKILEKKEERMEGQRKFLLEEKAAGRLNPAVERREPKKAKVSKGDKQRRRMEVEASNAMNGLFNVIGGFKLDGDGVDKEGDLKLVDSPEVDGMVSTAEA